MQALKESLKIAVGIEPALRSPATATGTSVDCLGYAEALIVLDVGLATATGSLAVKVQDSDDNSTFTDITSATFATVTVANDHNQYVGNILLKNKGRYVRVVGVLSTDDVTYGVSMILSKAQTAPVTQTNTVAFTIRDV